MKTKDSSSRWFSYIWSVEFKARVYKIGCYDRFLSHLHESCMSSYEMGNPYINLEGMPEEIKLIAKSGRR